MPLPLSIDNLAFRVGILTFFLAATACAVPQFFLETPGSLSFGMRQMCSGDRCTVLNHDVLQKSINCEKTCDSSFGALDFRFRWTVVMALGWAAAVLYGLIAGSVAIGLLYEVRTKPLTAALVLFTLLALFASGTSAAVAYATIECGSKCWEIGASSVAAVVAFLMTIASCVVVGLTALCVKTRHDRQMYTTLTAFISLCALGLQLYALLSNKWIFARSGTVENVEVISTGVFLKCKSSASAGTFGCERTSVQNHFVRPAVLAGCNATGVDAAAVEVTLYIAAGCFGLAALLGPLLAYASYRTPVHSKLIKEKESSDDDDDGAAAKNKKATDDNNDSARPGPRSATRESVPPAALSSSSSPTALPPLPDLSSSITQEAPSAATATAACTVPNSAPNMMASSYAAPAFLPPPSSSSSSPGATLRVKKAPRLVLPSSSAAAASSASPGRPAPFLSNSVGSSNAASTTNSMLDSSSPNFLPPPPPPMPSDSGAGGAGASASSSPNPLSGSPDTAAAAAAGGGGGGGRGRRRSSRSKKQGEAPFTEDSKPKKERKNELLTKGINVDGPPIDDTKDVELTEESPAARLLLIISLLCLVSVGNALVFYQLDGSGICSTMTYCQIRYSLDPSTSCNFGVSGFASLILNALLFVLLVVEIVQRCLAACESNADAVHEEWMTLSSFKFDTLFFGDTATGREEEDGDDDSIQLLARSSSSSSSRRRGGSGGGGGEVVPAHRRRRGEPLGKWYRWLQLLLLLSITGATIFGAIDSRWSVTSSGHQIGPWMQCTEGGKYCARYSATQCSGGKPGDEKTRHALPGVAAGVAVIFAVASMFANFGPVQQQVWAMTRAGSLAILEVCLVMAVLFWSQGIITCDGSEGPTCEAVSGGCKYGLAFWMVVGAMCGAGVVLATAIMELILSCTIWADELEGNLRGIKIDEKEEREEMQRMKDAAAANAAAPSATQEDETSLLDPPGPRSAGADYDDEHNDVAQQQQQQQQWLATGGDEDVAGFVDDGQEQQQPVVYDENSDPSLVGLDSDWRFDPTSGYWWSDERQLFFSVELGEYCSPETGLWTVNGSWPEQ